MKNALLKFAGLFVEKVPVDEQGRPLPKQLRPNPQPGQQQHAGPPPLNTVAPGIVPPQPGMPSSPSAPGAPPMQGVGAPLHGVAPVHPGMQPTGAMPGGVIGTDSSITPQAGSATVSVALRAWVPQEYAAHLAPFGLHVIAAGGSVTAEQAQSWGADVLIVSAECLGQDVHLLQNPQLATVFITPQPVMIPDVAGVLQVQEPLRASDVAHAVREAVTAFALR
jgi:hypothetical protein